MGSRKLEKWESICVLGLGYIGLPTAAMFATTGFQVLGVDVNDRVINVLRDGDIHIQEPGLKTLVQAAFGSGNLHVSKEAENADVFIIAVPTPFREGLAQADGDFFYKKADMRFVVSATEAVLPHLRPGNLVILESTSPPRTIEDLVKPILERSGLAAGEDFYLAYSPERVLPGQILKELIENARVIGGVNRASAEAGKALYQSFVRGDILLTDATTAEMTKLMENTYRDVNIALANEFSRLAGAIGFNLWDAITLANYHPRVNILQPGVGVGGHCISVDPWFLVEAASNDTPLIVHARQVNDGQPEFVVQLIRQALGGTIEGKCITTLGLAYKPDVDDIRESPAIEVAKLLGAAGAEVTAYDPFVGSLPDANFKVVLKLEEAISKADALVCLVKHQEFRSLQPEQVNNCSNARIVIDPTNCWNEKEWSQAGFIYYGLGWYQGKKGNG